MIKKIMASSLCLLWIGLFGCTHATPSPDVQSLDVEIIHNDTNCGEIPGMPNALWIADKAHLKSVLGKMTHRQIGGSLPDWVETFNFNDFGILFVNMGQKPTGGYRLEYIPDHARISGGTARVVLKWITPDADAMVTQMITQPCTMLKMPKAGFTRIEIMDTHGKLKAVVNRKMPE